MGRYGDSYIRFAGDFEKKYFIIDCGGIKKILQDIGRNDILDIKGLGRFSVLDNWKHYTKTHEEYNEIVLRKE